jgi:hypothetical protein
MVDTRESVATYQLSFCVSGAIARSTFSFSAHNVSLLFRELREAYQHDTVCRCSLTEIIDIEDAADGTTRPAVLDLALCRRSRGVVDGRIDLAQGLGDEANNLSETSQVHKLDEEVCARRKRERAKNQLHVNRAHQAIARMLLGGRGGHAGLVTWR